VGRGVGVAKEDRWEGRRGEGRVDDEELAAGAVRSHDGRAVPGATGRTPSSPVRDVRLHALPRAVIRPSRIATSALTTPQ
jgi:hypothetical protein